jgi:hypothetical protein
MKVKATDHELVLCNIRENQKMIACHIVEDEELFIIVQLLSDSEMKVLFKHPL